ncbi:hypothetical protein C8J57DRAFT_1471748 [Mycena rebaudengoi]|nr:hypothetical protein C8J57DRAFT_1471748 [Mycena rebaudengoi]
MPFDRPRHTSPYPGPPVHFSAFWKSHCPALQFPLNHSGSVLVFAPRSAAFANLRTSQLGDFSFLFLNAPRARTCIGPFAFLFRFWDVPRAKLGPRDFYSIFRTPASTAIGNSTIFYSIFEVSRTNTLIPSEITTCKRRKSNLSYGLPATASCISNATPALLQTPRNSESSYGPPATDAVLFLKHLSPFKLDFLRLREFSPFCKLKVDLLMSRDIQFRYLQFRRATPPPDPLTVTSRHTRLSTRQFLDLLRANFDSMPTNFLGAAPSIVLFYFFARPASKARLVYLILPVLLFLHRPVSSTARSAASSFFFFDYWASREHTYASNSTPEFEIKPSPSAARAFKSFLPGNIDFLKPRDELLALQSELPRTYGLKAATCKGQEIEIEPLTSRHRTRRVGGKFRHLAPSFSIFLAGCKLRIDSSTSRDHLPEQ